MAEPIEIDVPRLANRTLTPKIGVRVNKLGQPIGEVIAGNCDYLNSLAAPQKGDTYVLTLAKGGVVQETLTVTLGDATGDSPTLQARLIVGKGG